MTATWLLGVAGVLLLVAGPRLSSATWLDSSPRLGIALWQAVCVSAVGVPVLLGLTLTVPASAWVSDVSGLVDACAQSIKAAYGVHGDALEPTLGLLLSTGLTGWTAGWVGWVGWRAHRARARMSDDLRLVSTPGTEPGLRVLADDVPAAFCVPGRRAQVVITSGALEVLTEPELRSVMAHERAHLLARHHLATVLSQALARAFPRVALFDTASRQTRRLIELAADDSAARRVDRVTVASAIVRMAAMRAPRAALAMAEGAEQHATTARVGRLLSPGPPPRAGSRGLAVAGVVGLLGAPLLLASSPVVLATFTDLCVGVL